LVGAYPGPSDLAATFFVIGTASYQCWKYPAGNLDGGLPPLTHLTAR
jgi:hypothetical protein